MAPVSLPPGFRFHPSDEEIVGYYLKRKINGRKIELDIIPAVDLYKCEPWDLPDKSFLPNRDLEWYFFSPRDRKYPNGSRTNRATKVGYWKATGKDRKITSRSSVIGLKKTLVFYKGRAPQGKRTDWIMHEYRLDETQCEGTSGLQDAYVLCRVFKKNEIQPNDNNSEQLMGDSPIATANCLSDKISSEGFPQDQCDKSYSVVKHEDIGTQGDSRFPSEVSSDSPTNTIDNTSIIDPWLNVINESTDSPYIFKAPVGLMDNLNANSPVVRTSEQAAVLPLPKEENISRGLLDVRFDNDNCQSHFSSFSQELESGSEVEAKIITEILAKASENAEILVETSPFENALFYNSCSGRFCSSFFEDSAVFENPYYFWKD